MSNFLGRTPCAASEPGHRTSPPINQRGSRKAEPPGDRGSGRSEDPHREATCGVGPVTGSMGSEVRSGRGGRHPASSLEGLLVLIPSRGPHPCFRSGSALPVQERRPSPRRLAGGGAGSSLPTVLPWGESGTPSRSRFAGGGTGPGSQPVRRRWHRTRTADDVPHREATRGTGPVTGTVGTQERWSVRWSSPRHLDPKAFWCSYHQVTFTLRSPTSLPVGDRGRTGAKIHTARRLAASAR